MENSVIFPKPLQTGAKIAIVSPAGIVSSDFVTAAARVLANQGWEVAVAPHALGRRGSFSGTEEERFEDIAQAFLDPQTRAVLCSRGGYGAVHLLDRLSALPLEKDPKWLIGFSDISVLHALMTSKGIASLHASMTKHLALGRGEDADSKALFSALRGHRPTYYWKSHLFNRCGKAEGIIVGGNFAVLQALINTPYDIFKKGTILFIEDIGEPIYKIQRFLHQLRLNGTLQSLSGLIVGQFINYHPDNNFPDMESMIFQLVQDCDYPIVFGAPIGHVDHNIPIIESASATLTVTRTSVKLSFQ